MNRILKKLTRLYGWNERVLTQDDFDYFCGLERIAIIYQEIGFPGLYTVQDRQPIIVISPSVLPRARGWVQFHELGHHWRHGTGCAFMFASPDRIEREADIVAACALIPQPLIEHLTPGELHDEYRYPTELCNLRLRFYRELGF